jgi:hypothetical protein
MVFYTHKDAGTINKFHNLQNKYQGRERMSGMQEITYRFYLQKGKKIEYRVKLDPHTLRSVERDQSSLPEWTALDFHQ